MSCTHPYSGFETGRLTESGKKELILEMQQIDFLSLSSAEKRGFSPLPSKLVFRNGVPGLTDPVPIPCGCCVGCRAQRAKEWTTRCILESRQHPYNYFLTLTYKNEALPYVDGKPSLSKVDLQKFLKRFRKVFGPVRFFACGEYGDHTLRPHYHMILFCDKPLPSVRLGRNLYKSPIINDTWPLGLHEFSNADSGCMAYVSGYCVKKLKSELTEMPVPPFLQMSRRPGIGALNFSPEEYRDLKVYLENGKTQFLPKFLRSKLPFYEEMKEELAKAAKDAQKMLMQMQGFETAYDYGESQRISISNKIKERTIL